MSTVLVVDDSPTNALLVKAALGAWGYTVESAGSADQARALLEQQRPDLILMDIQLPGQDGLALTREIKADPRYQAIPVLALTALAMAGDEERARAAGCDGYITKPFRPETLVEQVRRLLGPPSNFPQETRHGP